MVSDPGTLPPWKRGGIVLGREKRHLQDGEAAGAVIGVDSRSTQIPRAARPGIVCRIWPR